MTPLALPGDVRRIGRLPDRIADAEIRPHLRSAGRMLAGWIGDYSEAEGDDMEAAKDAESCICMALMIPVLHTFFTEGAPKYTREIGEMEFMFHNPAQASEIAERWMERARGAVRRYQSESDSGLQMFAI